MTTPSREWLLARLVGLGNELTDEALLGLAAVAEAFAAPIDRRRDLSSGALAREQAARDAGDHKRLVGPWKDDGGHWMTVRETPDRTDYAACASEGAWTVYAYEANPDPDEAVEPVAAGFEDGLVANQQAADAHLENAGWIVRRPHPDAFPIGRALAAVASEVDRATCLHGRAFPGGWGPAGRREDVEAMLRAKDRCDAAAAAGGATLRDVLEEEVAEVWAEEAGSAEQWRELVQVAAVCVRAMMTEVR